MAGRTGSSGLSGDGAFGVLRLRQAELPLAVFRGTILADMIAAQACATVSTVSPLDGKGSHRALYRKRIQFLLGLSSPRLSLAQVIAQRHFHRAQTQRSGAFGGHQIIVRKARAILKPGAPHADFIGHFVKRLQVLTPHVTPLMVMARSDSCRLTVVLNSGEELVHVNRMRGPASDAPAALTRMAHVTQTARMITRLAVTKMVSIHCSYG